MKKTKLPPIINFHVNKSCQMQCRYCFAQFRDIGKILRPGKVLEIIDALSLAGIKRINWVGGEPLLDKNIKEYLRHTKQHGLKTSIITNGLILHSLPEKEFTGLMDLLDTIGISIDSLQPDTNRIIGRYGAGIIPGRAFYETLAQKIIRTGTPLKINTVVSSQNNTEKFWDFILHVRPYKWKIFQVLGVTGENRIEPWQIDREQFQMFLEINSPAKSFMIVEKDEDMKGAYAMIDPLGRFFDNTKGGYTLSHPIPEVGVEKAWAQISFDFNKFQKRYKHENFESYSWFSAAV